MFIINMILDFLVEPLLKKLFKLSFLISLPYPSPKDDIDREMVKVFKKNHIHFPLRNYAIHRNDQKEIFSLIKQYKFRKGDRWLEANFSIVFDDCVAEDVNIIEYLKAGVALRPEVLKASLVDVLDMLQSYEGVPRFPEEFFRSTNITSADILKSAFKSQNKCRDIYTSMEKERYEKVSSVYSIFSKKIYPNNLTMDDLKTVWKLQMDLITAVQEIAKNTNTHPMHAVASYYGTFKDERNFMVINATGINRLSALYPTHAPLIIKENGKYIRYGHFNFDSSSETNSHWLAYEEMRNNKILDKFPWIIHSHCKNIMEKASGVKTYITIGTSRFTIVGRNINKELGIVMVSEIIKEDIDGVILDGHGIWLFGKDINELVKRMVETENYS